MNSEKVKEIKKALETCMHTRVSSCRECPYNYTNTKTKHSECFRMAEHALTLINELESDNKSLQDLCNKTYEDLTKEIDRLENLVKGTEEFDKNYRKLDF